MPQARKSTWTIGVPVLAAALMVSSACDTRAFVVGFQNDGSSVDADVTGRPFGTPTAMEGLFGPADLVQDPSLSPDELEIFIAATRNGTYDIWTSTRASTTTAWGPPTLVAELSSITANDYEPDLSADGLSIHFASDRGPTNFRIYVAHRPQRFDPWGPPQLLDLGASFTDRGPAADSRALLMAFTSEPIDNLNFDLYLTSREAATGPWGPPVALTEINTSGFDWDSALYRRGLGLVFGSIRGADTRTRLFESVRPDYSTPFSAPRALSELDGPMNEGDPWLSEDGRHIVFSSVRTGTPRIYEAWR